jgi:ABC-type glycerol-3-phosphate transport system substrate-binding protein
MDDDQTFVSLDRSEMLSQLWRVSLSSFVDYASGTVSFDSDSFIKILEICGELSSEHANRDESVVTIESIKDFMEVQYYDAKYDGNAEILGFPTTDGVTSGNVLNNLFDAYAIPQNAPHKDAAWNFIKLCLSEEYQLSSYVNVSSLSRYFPTNTIAMEQYVASDASALTCMDESGKEQEITNRGYYAFEYHAATPEAIDTINNLIASISGTQKFDYEIASIISEEAESYFAGDKSANEVAEIIQNRVQIYVSEQWG